MSGYRRLYLRVSPIGQESEDGEDADAVGVFAVRVDAAADDATAAAAARDALVVVALVGEPERFDADVHTEDGKYLAPPADYEFGMGRRAWIDIERIGDDSEREPWAEQSAAGANPQENRP